MRFKRLGFLPVVLLILALSSAAAAAESEPPENDSPAAVESQSESRSSDFAEDLRVQGFVFGGGTSMSNVGDALVEIGGGVDYVFGSGIGIGAELSALGNGGGGTGTFGLNLSYHLLPDAPGVEPFVNGGVSFGSPPESGLDGYKWASAGGGINYWFGNGMALRIEVKGRYDLDQSDHTVGIRIGLTF